MIYKVKIIYEIHYKKFYKVTFFKKMLDFGYLGQQFFRIGGLEFFRRVDVPLGNRKNTGYKSLTLGPNPSLSHADQNETYCNAAP